MTLTFTRAASLLLATSALSLAACTNINLPPSTDSNVPVVDASIHPDGAGTPAPGATTCAVRSSQVTGRPLAGALLNGLQLQAGTSSPAPFPPRPMPTALPTTSAPRCPVWPARSSWHRAASISAC